MWSGIAIHERCRALDTLPAGVEPTRPQLLLLLELRGDRADRAARDVVVASLLLVVLDSQESRLAEFVVESGELYATYRLTLDYVRLALNSP